MGYSLNPREQSGVFYLSGVVVEVQNSFIFRRLSVGLQKVVFLQPVPYIIFLLDVAGLSYVEECD